MRKATDKGEGGASNNLRTETESMEVGEEVIEEWKAEEADEYDTDAEGGGGG